jgi:hypothetical protein
MRFDDDQMNITPEVAAFLGYAPTPSRQPARASAAETETPESGPDVIAVLGWVIGSVIIAIVGFLACIFVLMMIGFIGTVLSGPPAAATSVRPQINQRAPSTSRAQRRSTASQSASQAFRCILAPRVRHWPPAGRLAFALYLAPRSDAPPALRQKTARRLSRLAPASCSNGKTPMDGVASCHSTASTGAMPSSSPLRMKGARCAPSSPD